MDLVTWRGRYYGDSDRCSRYLLGSLDAVGCGKASSTTSPAQPGERIRRRERRRHLAVAGIRRVSEVAVGRLVSD